MCEASVIKIVFS